MKLIIINAILDESALRIINILGIGFVTITILWVFLFFKFRKMKTKIKYLENKIK